jgi:hypothetical protein
MHNDRDVSFQGHCVTRDNLGTRGAKTFVRGHLVSGRPTPPSKHTCVLSQVITSLRSIYLHNSTYPGVYTYIPVAVTYFYVFMMKAVFF